MESINFDRAADYYDATRGYPPEVSAAIGKALGEAVGATPETRFLEIGVGTGRIALPVAARGFDLTGVDIAERMLERLRAKLIELERETGQASRVTLCVADMTALPFPDETFDTVIAAHVFHLVSDPWQAAQEALRVLRPGGYFLICGDRVTGSDDIGVNEKWKAIIAELYGTFPNSAEAAERLIGRLRGSGAVLLEDELRPVSWDYTTTIAEDFAAIKQRLWSSTWLLPDAVYEAGLARLTAWCEASFAGRMEEPLPRTAEFVIRRLRRLPLA